MATIRKIQRQSGFVYKAIIKKNGVDLKSKTFSRKGDALAWAKRVEADRELMESLGTRGAGMRFSELVDDYIAQWTGKCRNQQARAAYWSAAFGNYKLVDVTTDMIRQQLKEFEAGKCRRGNGGLGKSKAIARTHLPSTVNRYRTVLSAIFKYAIGEGYLTVNLVGRVPSRKVNNLRTRYLNEGERQRLLAACKRSSWDRMYLLVLMAMTTGMRKAELTGLCWNNIDFDKNLAFLGDTKNGEQRYCPIAGFVMDELRPFRQVGSGLLFPSEIKPDKPMEFKKHWIKALAEADIQSFRWHDLRHTAASLLVMNGATLYETGEVLGHKSTQTTARYAHLSTAHKSSLIERVMTKAVNI